MTSIRAPGDWLGTSNAAHPCRTAIARGWPSCQKASAEDEGEAELGAS
jgi:hypothetical protein